MKKRILPTAVNTINYSVSTFAQFDISSSELALWNKVKGKKHLA